jgi:hypothetical protein
MQALGNPSKITFLIKPKRKIELIAAGSETRPKDERQH